ncbi:hypothetical protein M1373_01865 [Candidatus Marsarchaeota archaeon]|nr:hypothetical protein [Candidatus Marsarchaeota archaeon]MCL5404339.1 hypothetical protein [Candidatus Marsarchaeota archaeon]
MPGKKQNAQAAIEYLTTYGWAIIIISVSLAALYYLGVFNPATYVSTSCLFPADFNCISSVLYPNGTLVINLEQSTTSPINITAIGCNSNETLTHMVSFASAPIPLLIGSNITISGNSTVPLQCWENDTVFTGKPGGIFHGYILLNYTDVDTGYGHTIPATVLEKVV